MPETESILYRGANFELGHGPGFYGIWPAGSPRPPSIEWWPDTPDGWQGAWARYNALEAPGSITMVSQPAKAAGRLGTRALLAAGLLAAGIICGIAGLFPAYLGGSSLTSSASQLIPHVFYLAGWTASLVLILLGGARLKAGVMLSLGLSIVTFGLFFADAGQVIAGGAHLMGAGLALSLIGWVACAAGSVVALPLQAGFFRRSVAQIRSTFSPARPPSQPGPKPTPQDGPPARRPPSRHAGAFVLTGRAGPAGTSAAARPSRTAGRAGQPAEHSPARVTQAPAVRRRSSAATAQPQPPLQPAATSSLSPSGAPPPRFRPPVPTVPIPRTADTSRARPPAGRTRPPAGPSSPWPSPPWPRWGRRSRSRRRGTATRCGPRPGSRTR